MENQTEYFQQQEETIDLKKFAIRIIRNWYWLVISISISYSIAYIVNYYTDPLYSVSGTLVINDEKKSTAELLMNTLNTRKNLDNEIAILKSNKMAFKAINELPDFQISTFAIGRMRKTMLYKSSPFTVIPDSSSTNLKGYPVNVSIISKDKYLLEIDGVYKINKEMRFGDTYQDPNFKFTLFLKDANTYTSLGSVKYFFTMNDPNGMANMYRGKLGITYNERRGSVLTLSTVGLVPQMETDYINKLTEVYIRTGLEEKNQTSINTINFIDDQLSTVVDSLRKAEDKLQSFRLNNKILDVSIESSAIMDRISKIQEQKATYDMQIKYYKYLLDYINKKKDFREVVAPSVLGISDPLITNYIADLAKAFTERSVMSLSANQINPSLAPINAKIQNALSTLREYINENIRNSDIANADIDKKLSQIEREILQLPVTQRRLLNIERNFKLNDQIYNFLLQKRADAAIVKASNIADNKVLDSAVPENAVQISPQTSKNTTMGIIIGILIPVVILVLLEFFNNKIQDIKDIEKVTKVPILGSIGHNDRLSDIPVADSPKAALAESFRALRTNLQYMMRSKDKKVICVSSTISGEGKTFCAVNLACIIAQSNRKTLLLSLDLRKPKIHKIFNLENTIGLSTYLIGRSKYEDIIVPTNMANLFISTSGPIPPNPAELLETSYIEDFITKARQDFDVIIMDTPPLAIVTDALLLTRFSDANIFVVRQNYSSKDVLKLVDDLHFKRDIKNIGILVNDVDYSKNYGYGKKYGYGYSYGYGYEVYYGESEITKTSLSSRILNFFKS